MEIVENELVFHLEAAVLICSHKYENKLLETPNKCYRNSQ